MGSLPPNSNYNQPQYHHLRGTNQPATNSSAVMDPKATKARDFATSVYPSPADDVQSTFSAPSSPVFREQHVARPSSQEKVTLPPISSIMQMPSPSSSPKLPVASYKSPADAFLNPSNQFDNFHQNLARGSLAFDPSRDAQLFSDRRSTADEIARPQPLFPTQARFDQGKSIATTSHNQEESVFPTQNQQPKPHEDRINPAKNQLPPLSSNITKRQRKHPVENQHLREPPAPGTGVLGGGKLWANQIANPLLWYEQLKEIFPAPSFPPNPSSNSLAPQSSQNNIVAGTSTSTLKRKADSSTEMPPPKRLLARKDSVTTRQSASPREALMDAPEKKRVRRTDPNKPKAPRVSVEKVARNYSVYPDYCPPLSTLDSDEATFPSIDWKAAPQDMSNHEDSHLLHPKEVAVASKLVLTPSVYLYIKRRFFAHRLEYARTHQTFNINAAQLACKGFDDHGITGIDVNKTSRLHKAFDKVGWLDEKHMQRFL